MKKLLTLIFGLLFACASLHAQAPQYGRFHKSIYGSAAPAGTCLDGTLYFGSSAGQFSICKNSAWLDYGFATTGSAYSTTLPLTSTSTVDVTQGISPSYKQFYGRINIPASVTGGTQNFKAGQFWINAAASSAPAELWGAYGVVDNSGTPVSGYGVVGEYDNTAGSPTNAAFGVLGTYDGVTGVTATPTATGLFSAAVAGQVWDRNTTGPTSIFLALDNGDVNRQAANPIGAAFKAINRHISFATGFNYAFDSFIEAPFTRGALIADIRLGGGGTIDGSSGNITLAPSGTGNVTANAPISNISTVDITQGVSPSYKQIYSRINIPASVTGGTQNFKAGQFWINAAASSAPAELWGAYGVVDNSGTPISAYGVVGEVDNTAGAPTNALVGVLGTYDGVTSVTAAPTATGLFSAAVMGQVWDRNTTGPTAIMLAVSNGDTNRQAANPIPAAFRAINRNISFATGFNYGLDLAIISPFTRGALIADIRLGGSQEIYNGSATTRNAVRTQVGTQGSIGSLYLSTAGKMYLKVAIADADTDWEKVTTTAAD